MNRRARVLEPGAKVVVIGGGAAGLGAAYHLGLRGLEVVVLERAAEVGGKCRTVELQAGDGVVRAYDIGAVGVLPHECRETMLLARALGVTTEDINTRFRYLDTKSRLFSRPQPPSPLSVLRYTRAGLCHPAFREPGSGFAGVAKELARPFTEWAVAIGAADLPLHLAGLVSSLGYGYLDEVPAAYVLKYTSAVQYFRSRKILRRLMPAPLANSDFGRWVAPDLQHFIQGYQALLHEVARSLADVRCGVKVTRVERGSELVRVTYTDRDGLHHLTADALILASPLTIPDLEFLDLSPAEAELFACVRHMHYFSSACRITGGRGGISSIVLNNGELLLPRTGEPIAMLKTHDGDADDVVVVYSLSPREISVDTVREQLEPGLKAAGCDLVELFDTVAWQYFPHVGQEDFASGFYDELEALQGERRTYYVGGLLNFELVETTLAYSRRLVEDVVAA